MQNRARFVALGLSLAILSFRCQWACAADPDGQYNPTIAPASNEGQMAIAGFRLPAGLKIELVAAEPLLANPVAFCFDEQGRIYVAETFRQIPGTGVEDNRDHMEWLDDDLATQTVEDRLAFFKKHFQEKIDGFTKEHDRIRLLEDRDGDGKMDHATVFADGFNAIVDGTGAGVLARGGDVYYTCIPNLWLLRDTDGDGKADQRKSLHYGYGVRVAFRDHDMHGLCWGPDGKLYYSIGDRGYHVETDGRTLAQPDRGAVFRCNPDGTQLEVFASGLRNPQELAFDDFGNLFTCDNNSDSGDRARVVQLVEGGDSGWRMSYQYMEPYGNGRGPWNQEKLWHPQFPGQAPYIVPPIANLADGPCGLTYDAGVGLPQKYRQHFFLADFRGSAPHSGIRSFSVKPKGASFELADSQQFLWSILATDVDFGPDGSLYVVDWVEGWSGAGKGRIYRVYDPADTSAKDRVARARQVIGKPGDQLSPAQLVRFLADDDRRVRQAAQFALADRGVASSPALAAALRGNLPRLGRIHAIWALGQIGRKESKVLEPVVPLLADDDPEIRSQAARVLGDARYDAAFDGLVKLLKNDELRVRMFAALAIGKLGRGEAIDPLVEMLRDNDDRDPLLRHAAVMGLAGSADAAALRWAAVNDSAAARMGILLALRRLESPEIAQFLVDREPRLVLEAARAINDLPINPLMPQLAALATRSFSLDAESAEALWRRVLNANFRLGTAENARQVAQFAARDDVADGLRLEALDALLHWAKPSNRDRVMGLWRPLEPRPDNIAADAVRAELPKLLAIKDQIRQPVLQLAARLGITEVGPALAAVVRDPQRAAGDRAEALAALEKLKDPGITKAVEVALADSEPVVRAEAQRLLAKSKPEDALRLFETLLADGSLVERQGALSALGEIPGTKADALLSNWMDRLMTGQAPAEIELELLTAASRRPASMLAEKLAKFESARADNPLAAYHETLAGGSAERGRKLFFERTDVSCVRCHKAAGNGGEVGPDLSKIGAEKAREYLLEAMVDPNKTIAKGFESVTLSLDDGRVVSGVLKGEDDRQIRLITAEAQTITVAKNQIEDRATGKSPMPEDLCKKLSKAEIRDLVEFLAGLKDGSAQR